MRARDQEGGRSRLDVVRDDQHRGQPGNGILDDVGGRRDFGGRRHVAGGRPVRDLVRAKRWRLAGDENRPATWTGRPHRPERQRLAATAVHRSSG